MTKITASCRGASVKPSTGRLILCTTLGATYLWGTAAVAANLDLQEKCANRARSFLIELREDGKATYSGRNHYSEQLQKCFIWVGRYTSTASKIDWRESLLDAFEGESYGEFMFINDLTKNTKNQ
jgi:hypothetical protein